MTHDKTIGLIVMLYGLIHLLASLEIIAPKIVSFVIPVLVILVGLKFFTKDSV